MSYKQVIVVRTDLKIGKGKLAAQVAHASLGAYNLADKNTVRKWELEGSKKVVLRVDNLSKLKRIRDKARKKKLPCFLVRDAGMTQLRKGTITALGIGPAEEREIDGITKKLKLL